MTPKQFKDARKYLGYSLNEMADVIGVTDRAIRRYEDGEREISGPITRLISLLLKCSSAREHLEAMARTHE